VAIKSSETPTGMGATGWRVWETLLGVGGWTTQTALSKATGLCRSTVGRHISVLVSVGLVEKSIQGVRAVPHDDHALDVLAQDLGVSGASLGQRRRNGWTILPERQPRVDGSVVHLASGLPENQTCPHRPPCDREASEGSGCMARNEEAR